jgi:RNA polymerase sigma factor (sigma-70 family)
VGVGDAEVSEFCDRIRYRLVGALVLSCGDAGVAEELAQDTLVRAWERWSEVSRMESPEGWVFRTGFNLAGSWRRRRAAERRANRRATDPEHHAAPHPVAEVEAVRQAVAGLPDRQRAVIVARYYLGYDVAATAALLDCAEGTVKAATSHAVANLRRSGLMSEIPEDLEAR